ncbi:excinuclease ABC subunit UvrC [Metallumcola ferriviriculae]|uniref:UvrABC system protein C n=1 Tax=Metallumcola ferriviriculae TaxID=3039180 RepID=A0AAU0UKM4_9FIRM|nr:excinuclease ABC subunit UvrC [Desulfitibacteraceae bacterium MK1]
MTLEEKLKYLPAKPGVYLMKDAEGQIIYVGKARSLTARVRSYFRGVNSHTAKVQALVERIVDLEYIVTDTEVEALILECNLIKRYRPRYNINMKDDKHYPYLKVTVNEEFPRVVVTRAMKKDGAKYFGPYTQVGALRETMRLLQKLFPVRRCRQPVVDKKSRPCLNAHIKRCLAPCGGQVSAVEYGEMVKELILFLEGRQDKVIKRLADRMNAASARLEYEKAAKLRDQLQAVENVVSRQKIISSAQEDQDIIAFARGNNEVCVQVFFVRQGKLLGRNHFFLKGTDEMSRSEVMTAFVKQYYSRAEQPPKEVLLQEKLEDEEVIAAWLGDKRGSKVYLKVPQRGEKLKLVEMVGRNALMQLQEDELSRQKKEMSGEQALLELRERLGLETVPQRIECYDISNTQGTNSVASMVVFENGQPKNDRYRRFKIKTVQGPDDFASIAEVIGRRFRRSEHDGEGGFNVPPDVVIVDGGKGQLSAARRVMHQLGVAHIPTFGLAKEEELLFQENSSEPIRLQANSEALYLVQRIRDEAHRFAITYHRSLRQKESIRSLLDEVPGIGPKRKQALLKRFGSVKKISQADMEELLDVPEMNEKAALQLLEYLGRGV